MNFISYKGIKSFAMSSYFLGLIAKYGLKGATTKIFGKVNKFILGEIIFMVHLIQTMSYQAWIVPLHCKVGNVHPEWFMSDDASQYYKCWSQVFKRQPKRLLCIWHVDRAWRND